MKKTFGICMFAVLLILPKPENLYAGVLEIIAALVVYLMSLVGSKALTKEDLGYIRSVIGF